MPASFWLRVSAILGGLAVGLGAFGAHGLKEVLQRNHAVDIWEKAVFYHFIHAVMLFVLSGRTPLQQGSCSSFLVGIILFCGSLYGYALLQSHWLVYVTPFGGVSFLIGWVWLAACPRTK
jgi:uncharacterized membrane protein YgdD (TMEM256/DUF423 family)